MSAVEEGGGGQGTYIPVPVAAAQRIAEEFGKSVVIVCAFDPVFGKLHTTTYGTTAESKAWAADGGEIAAEALGALPDQATFYENFRQHCCVGSGHVSPVLDRNSLTLLLRCAAHKTTAGPLGLAS